MATDFVQTGQTFTADGAPYCPIENRRRGTAAVVASISVLFLGVTFLAFAMLAKPLPTNMAGTDLSESPSITKADIVAPEESQTEDIVSTSEAVTELNVADAIAQSRLARAADSQSSANQLSDFAPSLKPRGNVSPTANRPIRNFETPYAIQKPTPRVLSAFSHNQAPTTAATPFFFASDIQRIERYLPNPAIALSRDIAGDVGERVVRISKGENFVDALKRAGISSEDRNDAAYAFGKHYNLRRLRPGQEFVLTLGWPNQTLFQQVAHHGEPEARLLGLSFRADPENKITMRRNQDGALVAKKTSIPLTTRLLTVSGRIEGSLYLSAKAVGAPDEVIADLADAFAYDVDFQREIFGGDEFEAIFEARYDERGELVSTGDIVFARLNWRGRSREKGYYLFAGSQDRGRPDFYDAAGQGAKRLLMKTPIDGARLSSGFGTRKHPILGYRRAHKGVDFAAARGTPIKAAGDGVVERADRYGSFGNYIRIRHANGYKTAYAHLKGFRRGIRKGKHVRQGDIIGYVGTTGRSTGPHLHYEVHLNGKAVNPQRLKIATGKKLRGADLEKFKAARDEINAMRFPAEEAASKLAQQGVGASVENGLK